jgi:Adenylate kinase and related kinases
MKIHLLGPSGSGTSTLGRLLAEAYGCPWLDSDDFFWIPTDPPFTTIRPKADRSALLAATLAGLDSWVLSGSAMGWADFIRDGLDLVVYKYVEPAERLRRLRAREAARFGDRIGPGGDMREKHLEFIAWAMRYEGGGMDLRSAASEAAWMEGLPCRILRLEGARSPEEECELVRRL